MVRKFLALLMVLVTLLAGCAAPVDYSRQRDFLASSVYLVGGGLDVAELAAETVTAYVEGRLTQEQAQAILDEAGRTSDSVYLATLNLTAPPPVAGSAYPKVLYLAENITMRADMVVEYAGMGVATGQGDFSEDAQEQLDRMVPLTSVFHQKVADEVVRIQALEAA